MHADPRLPLMSASRAAVQPARAFAAVAACVLAVLAVFWPTTLSMIDIWRGSDTYQHCFAVVPIALWIVWQQRFQLAAEPQRPFWPGTIAIIALGFAWLLGVVGTAQVISHFALIGLVGALVLTVFGVAWTRILWFPLLFLFFAVPFGEALVPRLMDWTADFTVWALRLSGVPVFREGVHFVIPTGQWSVIEACSGIKFLIASLMAGSLYAWLMYRSAARRLAFVAASLIMPIVANWMRAYLIVMIGHLSKNRLMTNEDHIVFGWILFGAIMLLLYWVAARWREDKPEAEPAARVAPFLPARQLTAVLAVAAGLVLVWPAVAAVLMRPDAQPRTAVVAVPVPEKAWRLESDALTTWRPELDGASASRTTVFGKDDRRVGVFVAAYQHQTQQGQVGSSVNQITRSSNDVWKQTARGVVRTSAASPALPDRVRMAEVRGPHGSDRLLVWHWYWSGDSPTISAGRTKLDLARARLLRQPDGALWIAVYTPVQEDRQVATQALEVFVRDMGPSLQRAFSESVAR